MADHLGSTNGLADATGSLTATTGYDAFGNQTGTIATRYGFTGRERDDLTGLMYYRNRWYDARLGRFISEDPIGFGGGDVNLYGYVRNMPLWYRDPTGLQPGADVMANPSAWQAAAAALAAAGSALGAVAGPAASSPAVVAGVGFGAGYAIGYYPGQWIANHPSNQFVNGPWNPFGTPAPMLPPFPITPPNSSPVSCRVRPRSTPFYPLPPNSNPPPDDNGGDTCMRLLVLCLENPYQPGRKKSQWGTKKDCGACYRECKADGGAWPFYKCPIFED